MVPELANRKTTGVIEILLTAVAAFWLGLIVLLFVAVPTIFSTLPDDRSLAGRIAAGIFARTELIRVILAAGIITLGMGTFLKHRQRRATTAFPLLALLGGIAVAVGVWYVAPAIARGQADGTTDTPAFRRLHGMGSGLLLVEAGVSFVLMVMTVVLTTMTRGKAIEPSADA